MTALTLYGKAGCHLCHDAQEAVREARARREFTLEEVDVGLDPRLMRRYGERIPVLAVDGQEVLELRFGAEEVVRALDRVAS